MTTMNIYMTFNGNCEEAFLFYESVFTGSKADIKKFKDMPDNSERTLSDEEKEQVMHVTLPINKSTVLMGSDTGSAWSANFKQGNNISISVNVDSREEADNLFKSLSKGGKVLMPMADTFWESYFGMLTDQFGIQWMVSFDEPTRKK